MKLTRAWGLLFAAGSVAACSLLTSLNALTPTDASVSNDSSTTDSSVADVAPDSCSDTQSSSGNCGRCGHDCLGGSCLKGSCQPITLATQQVGLGEIAQDDVNVYWLISGGKIMRASKQASDAGASQVGSAGVVGGQHITALAPAVFVAVNSGKSTLFGIDGGEPASGAAPTLMATFPNSMTSRLFVDGTHFYRYDQVSQLLFASARDGSNAVTIWDAGAGGMMGSPPVTIDGDQLVMAYQQTIFEVRAADKNPTVLGVVGNTPGAIAADKDGIYYTSSGAAAVYSIPRGGVEAGSPNPPIDNGGYSNPRLISAGGGHLAWVSDNGNTVEIHGCLAADCSMSKQALVASGPSVAAIAVDARAVYWTDPNRASVYMVAW